MRCHRQSLVGPPRRSSPPSPCYRNHLPRSPSSSPESQISTAESSTIVPAPWAISYHLTSHITTLTRLVTDIRSPNTSRVTTARALSLLLTTIRKQHYLLDDEDPEPTKNRTLFISSASRRNQCLSLDHHRASKSQC